MGHGDGQNNGFLRPNSLLAILALTDEDDCSATTMDLFVEGNPDLDPNLNLRCFNHPELVHPISRFTEGLLALRADNPDLLVYATITGIPTDIVPDPAMPLGPQVENILADSRMVEMVNPMDNTQLMPSCDIPGRGRAFPPRRMIQLAADLDNAGANGVVQSICQESFTDALDAIISKIADVLGGTCLPRSLNRNSAGEVECDVVEIIDPDIVLGGCAEIPGRIDDGIDEDSGRPRCIVEQIAVDLNGTPTDPARTEGWFYDDFSADVLDRCEDTPQRISFTGGAEPRNGSEVKLECLQVVQGSGDEVGVGTSCAFDAAICGSASAAVLDVFPLGLVCESASSATCQPTCRSDADCPGGYVCFDEDGDEGPIPLLCINPTCN